MRASLLQNRIFLFATRLSQRNYQAHSHICDSHIMVWSAVQRFESWPSFENRKRRERAFRTWSLRCTNQPDMDGFSSHPHEKTPCIGNKFVAVKGNGNLSKWKECSVCESPFLGHHYAGVVLWDSGRQSSMDRTFLPTITIPSFQLVMGALPDWRHIFIINNHTTKGLYPAPLFAVETSDRQGPQLSD